MPEWLVLTVGIVVTVVLLGGWVVISLIQRHYRKTTSVPPEDAAAYRSAVGERASADGIARDIGRGGNVGP